MKNLTTFEYANTRIRHPTFGMGDAGNGVFRIPYRKTSIRLNVIASNGDGWDHVSVSLPDRCPTWDEMDFIYRAFFRDNETAMQLHVPQQDHISLHPYCLHLWRSQITKLHMPAKWMVA